jgi:hypothetical protein
MLTTEVLIELKIATAKVGKVTGGIKVPVPVPDPGPVDGVPALPPPPPQAASAIASMTAKKHFIKFISIFPRLHL